MSHQLSKSSCSALSEASLTELIISAQKGGPEAMTELCSRFQPLILRQASSFARFNPALKDDYLGQAALAFVECVWKFHYPDYQVFPGYAKFFVRRYLIDRLRQEQRRLKHEQLLQEPPGRFQAEPVPARKRPANLHADPTLETYLKIERRQELETALANLPPLERQVLESLRREEISERELARRLGTYHTRVQRLRKSALSKLRLALAAHRA